MPAKKNKTNYKTKKNSLIHFLRSDRGLFIIGTCIVFLALYMLIGMISFFFTGALDQSKVINKSFIDLISDKQEITNWTGVGGAFISETLINKYFGIFSLIIPFFFISVGIDLMGIKRMSAIRSFILSAYILIWGSLFSSFALSRFFPNSYISWGGNHGIIMERLLENAVGSIGVFLIILLLLGIFIIITKQTSVEFFRKTFQAPIQKKEFSDNDFSKIALDKTDLKNRKNLNSVLKKIFGYFKREKTIEVENDVKPTAIKKAANLTGIPLVGKPTETALQAKDSYIDLNDDFEIIIPKEETYSGKKEVQPITSTNKTLDNTDSSEFYDENQAEEYDPTKDLSNFHFPSTNLLKVYNNGSKGVDMEEQKTNKEKIINTLRNYGIEITSIKATVGPTITLYEIVPQAGVRISKIRNLEDDIALSLAALGIRIIAPMPGKGTIGIEVPNKDPQIVSMQSVIASQRFQECNYDLPIALGKTITNEIFMFDLCKMPHLLVAGATGQGKSVGLNAIITSLLYKKHPAEMKMVLIDPKMVEFNIYTTIEKHYLAKLPDAEKAIITDVTKVTQTLNSLTKEMDDRYELLMVANVRTIKEYNEKFRKRKLNPLKGHRFLPYIVVIIDEFGDLIMTAGKEIEMPIARIAQKARAVGIHMVIATQRPTTNIITGTIKANFPARMAFRVTSQIDSRTILDMSGANQLIGRGDMLFSQGSDLVRIQCAFVDTPEVEEITQYIGNQQGYSHAFELPEYVGEIGGEDKLGNIDLSDRDPLFDEAARLIVVHQQGSTSLIQRKFAIGYNRAGRLMDQLEAAGIVGPTQGSKPREVFVMDEYTLEQKLSSI